MAQKTVLITGCSKGGIGDALTKAFHKKGARVFATARNIAKVRHLKALGIETLQLDVVDEASIKKAVESVRDATGGSLDILVNNSGAGYAVALLDADISEAKKLFDVNVFSVITVTQAFAPLLIQAKGTVVNIGSIAGLGPFYWQGYYNASKAAVNLLTDQLRLELAPLGVKVILVLTGAVKTKFFDNQPPVTVPADSFYAAGREEIIAAGRGDYFPTPMPVDEYAETVVRNALRTRPVTHQWAGSSVTPVWFLTALAGSVWHQIWDLVLPYTVHIPALVKKLQAAQEPK